MNRKSASFNLAFSHTIDWENTMNITEAKEHYSLADVVYIDWSLRRGITAVRNDEIEQLIYPDLLSMLDDLGHPHIVVGEATFESFDLAARRRFIDECGRRGHILLTVPTRETTKWRFRAGFGKKPNNQTYVTDFEDVQTIRHEAATAHLKRPGVCEGVWRERVKQANHELMFLRSTGEKVKRPRSRGYKFVPAKDGWAEKLRESLPPFADQPPVRQHALRGSDGSYNLRIVAAVGMAAKHARSTREFDRMAGLYSHGYGTQIRSDLMFWAWAGGQNRAKLNPETRKRDDISLSDYRRELRWLYHQLKESANL